MKAYIHTCTPQAGLFSDSLYCNGYGVSHDFHKPFFCEMRLWKEGDAFYYVIR